MSSVRVMAAFAAGATIAALIVGVARLGDVVERSTAAAEPPAPPPPQARAATPPPDAPRAEAVSEADPPVRWRAPSKGPEEVRAGVLAKVAKRASSERCEPPREPAARERRGEKDAPKGDRCPPEERIESVEIDWNGSPATR